RSGRTPRRPGRQRPGAPARRRAARRGSTCRWPAARRRRRGAGSLPGAAVEVLAEDVEVAEVAGRLLDHADEREAQRDLAAGVGVGADVVELVRLGDGPGPGDRLLVAGDVEREGLVAGATEVPVGLAVLVEVRPQLLPRPAGEADAEPPVLDQ